MTARGVSCFLIDQPEHYIGGKATNFLEIPKCHDFNVTVQYSTYGKMIKRCRESLKYQLALQILEEKHEFL